MADIWLDIQGGVAGAMPTAAPGHSKAQDWLSGIEKSNLTPRYYLAIGLFVLQGMLRRKAELNLRG